MKKILGTLSCVLLAFLCETVQAAVPVHIVRNDLRPLIRAAARSHVQFAVHLAHTASPDSQGRWSTVNGVSTWQYAVRVPTAVSLSFHAVPVTLSNGAFLTVRSAATTVSYRAGDIKRNDLWSRIQPGDTLEFTLTVPTAERSKVQLQIISLQAGYRALGSGVQDHPYYRQLMQQAGTGSASCVQNYACSVTSSNSPAGQATVAIVVANAYQCSGTLMNDVPRDNTTYLLTARHCETGVLGGGNPGQAAAVTVYWDAVTPCGQSLGSIYDPGIQTQTGATTIVEQQDAWLIQLLENPIVGDAQFAGFDASGGSVLGGYTIQHSLGMDKQFTSWFGQALSLQESDVLGSTYLSSFLQVVNQVGNVGPGASGSALVDQNNHVVGSLTLGRTTGDASGYGSCPVNPPSAPNGSNGVADFTALAAVWNSTADTSASTGTTTLQSILDPSNTGTLVVPSMAAASISFAASTVSIQTGQSAQLTWNAPNALQCTASGGLPGDGWTGTLPGSGSQSVAEGTGGRVVYKLTCTLSVGSVSASTSIAWDGSVPFVNVYIPRFDVWTTRPATITWNSNVSPCSVSGGSLSLTNQPSSGSATDTQSTVGDVTYQVSCGTGPVATSSSGTLTFITPSLVLQANAPDRLLGQALFLQWLTYADTCAATGGAPGDGWAGNSFGSAIAMYLPRVSTLGTYTYTLTCSSGSISLTQSVVVTIENNAPYVTASLTPTSTTYTASPADYVTLNWTTNLSGCSVNSSPALDVSGPPSLFPNEDNILVDGPGILAPQAPGTYTLTVTCDGVGAPMVTSAPLTLTVLQPPAPTAAISVTPASITAGQQFTVSWSSTNASSCLATGNIGSSGAIWSGGLPVSGSQVLSTNEPGQFNIGISCPSIESTLGSATAQTSIAIADAGSSTSSSSGSSSSGSSGSSAGGESSAGGSSGGSSSGGASSGASSRASSSGGGGAFDLLDLAPLLAALCARSLRLRSRVSRSRRETQR